MFYAIYPPWAAWLIFLAVVTLVACVVCILVNWINVMYSWRILLAAGILFLIGATSATFAAVQAYNSQITLYELSVEQGFEHVDEINAITGVVHAYNTDGNCYVYSKYDPYQKAMVIDGDYLRNSTISLNGTTVYGLTTKPLTQTGIDELCEANYGNDAFNNKNSDE